MHILKNRMDEIQINRNMNPEVNDYAYCYFVNTLLGCKVKVKVKKLSCIWLFSTPWTIAYEFPPAMEFSRQEYWSGLPFPSLGDHPHPGIEPGSPALEADYFTAWAIRETPYVVNSWLIRKSIKQNPQLTRCLSATNCIAICW